MSQPLSDFRPQSPAGAPQPPASEPAPGAVNPYESPDLVEVQENQEPKPSAFSPLESQIAVLLEQGRNGAKWFYWIAGFSIVNSLIMLVSGGIYFVVGLGITSVADGFAEINAQQFPETATLGKIVAFGFSAVVSLVVCGFGWLTLQRWQPVFFLGMLLYLLDGLLFLISGELLATAFHAYVLYGMWCGFQAYRQLAALERKLMDPFHPVGEFNPHQTMPTDAT